ncbi:TIGR04086 family membrane protein [Oscillospiraceae bacterium CM]|nr:TIGR04086 family membrane protein [Oscillospiraceae bacterium CM]
MRKNDNQMSPARQLAVSVVLGAVVGIAAILILFAGLAALIVSGTVPENLMVAIVCAAAFAGALIGAFVAGRRNKSRIVVVGALVGAVLFGLTLLGASLNENGSLISSRTPVYLAVFLLGGVLGGALNMKKTHHKRA